MSPLLASAGMVGISSTADAAVTIGAITAFPDRDMVGVSGYNLGERLTIEVLRAGDVIGSTSGVAIATDDGPGLEVNHGPEGTPQPGECWNVTPDIRGGDLIRVTTPRGVDTMPVADVELTGNPRRVGNTVEYSITSSVVPDVEFRHRPTDFRPRAIPVQGTPPSLTAVFSGTAAQLDAAMEADWRAGVDITGLEREVTLSESDGVNGPAAGCPTLAEQRPGAPTMRAAQAGEGQATVNWAAPLNTGTTPISSYQIEVGNNASPDRMVTGIAANATSSVVTGLTPGTTYTFQVRAVNAAGPGAFSSPSTATPTTGTGTPAQRAPGVPAAPTAVAGNAQATVNWNAPTDLGSPALSSYNLEVRSGGTVVRTVRDILPGARPLAVTGLTNGTSYTFAVQAVNTFGSSGFSGASSIVTPQGTVTPPPVTRPGTPGILQAASGVAGRPITATANWSAPTTGGTPTGYRVQAWRAGVRVRTSALLSANLRTFEMTLPAASNYRFRVQAVNGAGTRLSPLSPNTVTAR